MASEPLDEKSIFNIARKIDSPAARIEYLRQACGADAVLLEQVETLLRAYEEQASFLESPPASANSPTIDQSRNTTTRVILRRVAATLTVFRLAGEARRVINLGSN
jgi:hypothetical protein